MVKKWICLAIIIVMSFFTVGCFEAAVYAVATGVDVAGSSAAKALDKAAAEDAKKHPTATTFAPEIDTEQSVKNRLDKEGEIKNEWVMNNNTPESKFLFYYRKKFVHPILFTYDEAKGKFVYQHLWTWKKEDFEKIKDTPKYKKACEEAYSGALADRSYHYEKKGRIDIQYEYIKKIEQVSPIGAKAYNVLGWFFATCSNPEYRNAEKAIEYAEQSVSIVRAWGYLDTLAAAYAEANNFDKAVQIEEEAIRLCADNKQREELIDLLHGYRQNKTYVQIKQNYVEPEPHNATVKAKKPKTQRLGSRMWDPGRKRYYRVDKDTNKRIYE